MHTQQKRYQIIEKNIATGSEVPRLGYYWSEARTEMDWLKAFHKMEQKTEMGAYSVELHEDGATIHHKHLPRALTYKEVPPVTNVLQQVAMISNEQMEILRLKSLLDMVLAATGTRIEEHPGFSADEKVYHLILNDKTVLPVVTVTCEYVSPGATWETGFSSCYSAKVKRVEREDDGSITVVIEDPAKEE